MANATPNADRYVISVLIPDRAGILREITSAVSALKGNIDSVRQTVTAGYFNVTLTASFVPTQSAKAIETRLASAFAPGEATINVIAHNPGHHQKTAQAERYTVTLTGQDRPDILKTITAFFAERNINIEDWDVEFNGSHITNLGLITVPGNVDLKQMQTEFKHLADRLSLHAVIQHENIFKAMSEIGPITPLVTQSPTR